MKTPQSDSPPELATDGGLPTTSCSPSSVRSVGNRMYIKFHPHGIETPLELPVITSGYRGESGNWTWNGSLEKPTLRPSVKVQHGPGGETITHLWLNEGICQHLEDSTDGFAGQTLPLQSLGWRCDLGNGERDHDWQEIHETSGGVDGGPGDEWTTKTCRVCGFIQENVQVHTPLPARASNETGVKP